MTAAVRVAIVLVNWNGWRDAVECLGSIFASDAPSVADVYLVDNASSDGSVQHIEDWCADPRPVAAYARFDGVRHVGSGPIPCRRWRANGDPVPETAPGLTIVESGANSGFAGGNNIGIQAAGLSRYSHFWLLNTDTVIRHDALGQLLARAAADPKIGMVGSTLIYYHEPELVQAMAGARIDLRTAIPGHIGDRSPVAMLPSDGSAVEREMAYVVGASMLVTREFVERVGPMQEDYFLYYEEIDWAFRAGSEFTLGYAPRSVVYHKVGGSTTRSLSEYALNVRYRSRVRFTSRFLPASLPSVRRMLAFEVVRHLLKGRWMPARLAARTLKDSGRLAASAPAVGGRPR